MKSMNKNDATYICYIGLYEISKLSYGLFINLVIFSFIFEVLSLKRSL